MATRRETSGRRRALADSIRAAAETGSLLPGAMLPTVRELQATHELSARIVHEELRRLVDEGLLVSRPRVGFFLAEREALDPDTYLIVLPADRSEFGWPAMFDRVQLGFEDQITQLGGAAAALAVPATGLDLPVGDLPEVTGIFAAGARDGGELRSLVPPEVPRVRWQTTPIEVARQWRPVGDVDTVAPDHRGAGQRAADHLARRGHRRIGFLGLGSLRDDSPRPHEASTLCEEGWRDVVAAHDQDPADLTFRALVDATHSRAGQVAKYVATAATLVARRDITAVVCASMSATEGLMTALREVGVPADAWPTMVTAGNVGSEMDGLTTSIRIPYEDLGRTAAQILWQRAHGTLSGPAQHRVVPMPMVRRPDAGYAWAELTQRTRLTSLPLRAEV